MRFAGGSSERTMTGHDSVANRRVGNVPKLGSLNLDRRSAMSQNAPVSPLTPDSRSGGFSRSQTNASTEAIPSQRRSYSVPSIPQVPSSAQTPVADVPPLPPISKIQSRVRAHKARAILKQFQDEEEERLAEVHGMNSPRQRVTTIQAAYVEPSQRYSQAVPTSPLHTPSPSTPVFAPRFSGFGSLYGLANRSRDELFLSRTGSTPDLLRTTMHSSPRISREHLVSVPAEIEGDEYFHSELPTAGAEVIELEGERSPAELGSSPPRQELSATLSVRQKPPRYRPPQFDYLDSNGVSKYNTLPGEAFPFITNSDTMDPEELPSGDERLSPLTRGPSLEADEETKAIRRSIEPEEDPRTSRSMSIG